VLTEREQLSDDAADNTALALAGSKKSEMRLKSSC